MNEYCRCCTTLEVGVNFFGGLLFFSRNNDMKPWSMTFKTLCIFGKVYKKSRGKTPRLTLIMVTRAIVETSRRR